MQDIYPKILIIGETFRHDTGGGITISNLFHAWPAEKLAVITLSDINDFKICKNYYRIGIEERNSHWPFRLLQKKTQSGKISFSENDNHSALTIKGERQPQLKTIIFKIAGFISHFVGVHHKLHSINVSDNLLHWTNRFQPEIIYFQPNSLALVLFVKELYKKTKLPIALHIVDDYINTKNKPGLFYYKYERVIQREYNDIVKKSIVHFSICDEMSKEYNTRFNKEFIPIHNPVIKEFWLPFANNTYELGDTYRIVYAGRIGIANVEAIILLVDIVDQLLIEGIAIEFDIYSIDEDKNLLEIIHDKKGSNFKSFIPHNELPEKLSKYDFLFLPLSINEKSIRYTRLSMPTKVAEYMITGKPILVFAPPATALYKYASTEKWAYVTDNKMELTKGLRLLINSIELREKIGKTAQRLALDKHEIKEVAKIFSNALLSDIN